MTTTELENKLFHFVKYFVAEVESTLAYHHTILDGNIVNSETFADVFSQTSLKTPSLEIPLFPNIKPSKLIERPIDRAIEVIYKNKSLAFYQLVYSFDSSNNDKRYDLVGIAIEVFKSLQFQFNGITSTQGLRKAMQRCGEDAAHRYIKSYMKEEKDSPSDENKFQKLIKSVKETVKHRHPDNIQNFRLKAHGVFVGKSKGTKILGIIPIHKKPIDGDFDIQYKCQRSQCGKVYDWNTTGLYNDVGIIHKNNGILKISYKEYVKTNENYKTYGFRCSLPNEKFQDYKYNGKYKNQICGMTCMRAEISNVYNNTDFYEEQHNIIVAKIYADRDNKFKNNFDKIFKNLCEEFKPELKNLIHGYNTWGESFIKMFQLDREWPITEAADSKNLNNRLILNRVDNISMQCMKIDRALNDFKIEMVNMIQSAQTDDQPKLNECGQQLDVFMSNVTKMLQSAQYDRQSKANENIQLFDAIESEVKKMFQAAEIDRQFKAHENRKQLSNFEQKLMDRQVALNSNTISTSLRNHSPASKNQIGPTKQTPNGSNNSVAIVSNKKSKKSNK
ncbi:uncharacterized protein LOC143923253 [Arctopsyche grandis]|uniref:uncharacterized protein LOC143923253 n=1 Tax=Arctopsyche grandis TaxID=121162 RepID=UPI00406D839F